MLICNTFRSYQAVRYDLEEEMCNAQKRGSGCSPSKMHADAQNYPFERSSSNMRQWCLFYCHCLKTQPNYEARTRTQTRDTAISKKGGTRTRRGTRRNYFF